MKRFLIFAAVAPPLGFIIAFWVMLQIANWMAGGPSTFDLQQVAMLPTIYVFGVIPALLMAWFDHVLAKREMSYRIALTALFAYFLSYVPLLGAFRLGFMHEPSACCCSASSARCRPRCVRGWRRNAGSRLAREACCRPPARRQARMRSSGLPKVRGWSLTGCDCRVATN